MDMPERLVFVVQGNQLQGLIWQALLKSQGLSVILEAADSDLIDCIDQLATAGLSLPDVILLDAEASGINPYEFCRWCRDNYPDIKVFLTRSRQAPLSDTEKRWAVHQGAAAFLDGFHRETLMLNAAENVKSVLGSLSHPFLDQKALISVLLNIRRRLDAGSPDAVAKAGPSKGTGNKDSGRAAGASGKVVSSISWRSQSQPGVASAATSSERVEGKAKPAKPSVVQFSPPAAAAEPQPVVEPETPDEEGPVRRYRGVAY